jgi:hypothetical protein
LLQGDAGHVIADGWRCAGRGLQSRSGCRYSSASSSPCAPATGAAAATQAPSLLRQVKHLTSRGNAAPTRRTHGTWPSASCSASNACAKARRNYAGTSLVTRASGKKKIVAARFAHNDRLIDTLMIQAFAALRVSPGARTSYDDLRARGIEHNDALRRLANRLAGILHGCLKAHARYDETTAWGHREIPANLPSQLDIQNPGMSWLTFLGSGLAWGCDLRVPARKSGSCALSQVIELLVLLVRTAKTRVGATAVQIV